MKHGFKVLMLLMVLLALGAASASGQGKGKGKAKGGLRLGLEFGNPNAVLIIRPDPFDFKVGYNFTQSGYLFLSADYRIVSGYQIVDFLHFFLGVGAYANIYFEPADFHLGARIPLGIQVFLLDNVLELFLEIVPTVGLMPALEAFPEWQGFIGFTLLIPRR